MLLPFRRVENPNARCALGLNFMSGDAYDTFIGAARIKFRAVLHRFHAAQMASHRVQHGPCCSGQRAIAFTSNGSGRFSTSITQVVVYQDIAKPADFAPRYVGVLGIQRVGQMLRSFR